MRRSTPAGNTTEVTLRAQRLEEARWSASSGRVTTRGRQRIAAASSQQASLASRDRRHEPLTRLNRNSRSTMITPSNSTAAQAAWTASVASSTSRCAASVSGPTPTAICSRLPPCDALVATPKLPSGEGDDDDAEENPWCDLELEPCLDYLLTSLRATE